MKYILSIDQGTSSSRAIIFDENGAIKYMSQKPVALTYPQDGWVEQCPLELVDNTVGVIKDVISKDQCVTNSIAVAGITNQRETIIIWDRKTGAPVYNAIVWQDRRTADFCATLRRDGVEDMVREKTGLLLDPYFSATKIKWILDNVEGARLRAENGELLLGTVDCYLLWHLSGRRVHATDATNASRTMLYNINSHCWDSELLKLFDVPRVILPKVMDNIAEYSQIDSDIFGLNLTIGGMAGDQQAALIGQGCVNAGMVKSTYGTGCFMLMNIGDKPVISKNKLLTTIACSIDGRVSYAMEGSIFNAGTAIQFLRDNLGLISHASDSEKLALSVPDNGGVYFVPAFTGLGAPYWNPAARGVICGLGRDSGKAHIVRAALEAQAYQTRDLIGIMEGDSGYKVNVMRIDGGLTANKFMCQFLSDQLGVATAIPRVLEATAWGAACLAGVQAGLFSSINDISSRWKPDIIYSPSGNKNEIDGQYVMWKKAVEKSCGNLGL